MFRRNLYVLGKNTVWNPFGDGRTKGIQNVALVLLERAGSSERYSGSVTGDDIVTEKRQEGKYGLGEFWPGFYVFLSNPAQTFKLFLLILIWSYYFLHRNRPSFADRPMVLAQIL